jgi:hypothetical protein
LLSLWCTRSARSVVTCDRKEQPVRDQHQQGDFLKSVLPILDGEFAILNSLRTRNQYVKRASQIVTFCIDVSLRFFLHKKMLC